MSLRRSPRGQVLVIVGIGMVALVAAVGLVIDAGFAWGQQRDSQNANDAMAEAGAIVLTRLLQTDDAATFTDAAVDAAVADAAAENGVIYDIAYYTDLSGVWLTESGTTTTDPAAAAVVGSTAGGAVPPCLANCAGPYASGVHAFASKAFDTFLVRVVGIRDLTTRTEAIAIGGYVPNPCEADDGCAFLPVTPPINVVTCDGTNRPVYGDPPTEYAKTDYDIVIPLCMNGSGNVGWIDWDPSGGGASELADEILPPVDERTIKIPDWYQVSQTGDINSSAVEDALNYWAGQVVVFPLFAGVCSFDPGEADCPPDDSPGGDKQWYHLERIGYFLMSYPRAAWITGNADEIKAVCGTASESGATSCLTGRFVDVWMEGTVGAAPEGERTSLSYGIQLIR